MKIVTIVGARPQFIKAAAVSRAIRAFNRAAGWGGSKKRIREILVHTGQHYDYFMDKVFFEELRLPRPDYHLGVGSCSHARQTGMMLERIESVLEKEKPQMTIVYGDTNSTLAGALTAAKLNIPVAHVEAGLRSYKRSMPEEINRLITDHLSTILYCPTAQAVRNLSREGIRNGDKIVVRNVGDVMYDSILYYSQISEEKSAILKDLNLVRNPPYSRLRHAPRRVHGSPEPHMVQGELQALDYYLATVHRAENTDSPSRLKSILKALKEIGKDCPVVLPLHPRTRKMMRVQRLIKAAKGIQLIDPVPYLDMLKLEKHARVILTDSGGVQKEAYWFRVPCITLRDETEWTETIRSGWNVLVGTDSDSIVKKTKRQIGGRLPASKPEIFGDGKASEKIIQALFDYFLR